MGRIRGVILAGLGGFGIGMILCRLYALEPEHSLVFALAALLGAAAGGGGFEGGFLVLYRRALKGVCRNGEKKMDLLKYSGDDSRICVGRHKSGCFLIFSGKRTEK